MGYSIENFKNALKTSAEFADVISSNGYNTVDGTCQVFKFEKLVAKTSDGAEESFLLVVTNQISGHVSADLYYSKKLKESSDYLKINQWLCSNTNMDSLDYKIKECEKMCLLVGANFKK